MRDDQTKTATGFLLIACALTSCASEMGATASPGICIYNSLKTIPGITSLQGYGKDTDFIRYGYSDAKGDETSSTLMIGTSGTPPRTWFEGAYPMVMDDPVHKGQEVLIAKCQVDPRLLDQTLAVGGSPTMTWRRAN